MSNKPAFLCDYCGNVTDFLETCEACGSWMCPDCFEAHVADCVS